MVRARNMSTHPRAARDGRDADHLEALLPTKNAAGPQASALGGSISSPLLHACVKVAVGLGIVLITMVGWRWVSQARSAALNEPINPAGWTLLMEAAHDGDVEQLNHLLRAGVLVDAQANGGWSALMLAAFHGHVDVVSALLAAGASIEQAKNDGFTALMLAVDRSHANCVQKLIQARADTNVKAVNGW